MFLSPVGDNGGEFTIAFIWEYFIQARPCAPNS